jgi:hypothetical protein
METGRGVYERHARPASALKLISESGDRCCTVEEAMMAFEENHVTNSFVSNKAVNLHLHKLLKHRTFEAIHAH